MKSTFSLKEKYTFWKRKWLKEHLALLIFTFAVTLAVDIFVMLTHRSEIVVGLLLINIVEYLYLRHRMMTYVEHKIYD